jgi:hypothetical protein
MADFNIRSDSVDVEQIMRQIRSRIQEKRGVDYTEEQIRELATVRLEKFLDPKNLRSDLLEQFRKSRPPVPSAPAPAEPPYVFDDQTLFATHRGPLAFMRKLMRPILKLFFNPNTLNHVLHKQAEFNVDLLERQNQERFLFERSRAEWNTLYYEILHNLVVETTRTGIEVKNMRMRLESLSSRLDFSERRVRALEGVVQYRPEAVRSRDRRPIDADAPREGTAADDAPADVPAGTPPAVGDGTGRRRRRRRRGRRGAGPGEPGARPAVDAEGAANDADVFADGDAADDGADLDSTPEPEPETGPGDIDEQ